MEYGYLQAGLVDFAIVFLLLIFLFNTGWFTLWGLSGGLKKFFSRKKEKTDMDDGGW
tara:strand:+ start:226 stop:396 length:171 start_codon:yes stop_codon:yes gene_type:complete